MRSNDNSAVSSFGRCLVGWRLGANHRRPIVIIQRRYVAYLLRLWLSDNAGEPVWRGSLEDPHTGNRLGFADLPSLFEYLRKQTEIPSSAPSNQD